MNTANLSKWVDELQGQIDQLKLKVAKAGQSGDTITPSLTAGDQIATINTNTALYAKKAVAPFIDTDNVSTATSLPTNEATSYTATEDCAIIVQYVTYAVIDDSEHVNSVCVVGIPGSNTPSHGVAYVKKGQTVSMIGANQYASYQVAPLLEATQPLAATRSTKKKGGK